MKLKEQADNMLKRSIDNELDKIMVPNMDDIWANIESHLKDNNKKQKVTKYIKRHNKLISSLIFILVTSLFFLKATPSDSRLIKMLNSIVSTKNGQLSIDLNTKTLNEDDKSGISGTFKSPIEYMLTFEELKNIENIDVKIPNYIPHGYEFHNALLLEQDENVLMIEMVYINLDNKTINLKQEPMYENQSHSINLDSNNIQYKEIVKDNIKYYLIIHDNRLKLMWSRHETKYTITASLKEEEILKIALNIN